MTKRFLLAATLTLMAVMVAGGFSPVAGQSRNETKAKVGPANVTIAYGRPALKGRDPLKMIQPGQPWRIGSNAPTTIESDADLSFGGTTVPKGKHILLAMLDKDGKWSLIVSSKGNFDYEPSAKIAEAPMELSKGQDAVEQLEIKLTGKESGGTIEVAWGTLRLTANFAAAK
jgi:nucleoid-associated protein YgaU